MHANRTMQCTFSSMPNFNSSVIVAQAPFYGMNEELHLITTIDVIINPCLNSAQVPVTQLRTITVWGSVSTKSHLPKKSHKCYTSNLINFWTLKDLFAQINPKRSGLMQQPTCDTSHQTVSHVTISKTNTVIKYGSTEHDSVNIGKYGESLLPWTKICGDVFLLEQPGWNSHKRHVKKYINKLGAAAGNNEIWSELRSQVYHVWRAIPSSWCL